MDQVPESQPGQRAPTSRWDVFLCYRQVDGGDAAAWLHEQLHGRALPIGPQGHEDAPVLEVYYDRSAPAVDDWTALHQPALERARALLLIVSPGAQHRQDADDWVHRELDWWLENRQAAPIFIDSTGEGERWLPAAIRRRWPQAQRVEVLPREWAGLEESDKARITRRTVAQILGGIQSSELRVQQEDFERERARRRRLERQARTLRRQRLALSALLVLAALAIAGFIYATRMADQRAVLVRAGSILGQAAMAEDPVTRALVLAELRDLPEPEGGTRLARRVASTAVPITVIGTDEDWVRAMAVSPGGERLALAFDDGRVRILRIDGRGPPLELAERGSTKIRVLAFSPDERLLAGVDSAGALRIWRPEDQGRPRVLDLPGRRIRSVAFSPDSRSIATMSEDGVVHLWELADRRGEPFEVPSAAIERSGHRQPGVYFSPTGTHLLILGQRAHFEAFLWPIRDAAAPTSLGRVFQGTSHHRTAVFSPDGRFVALARSDTLLLVSVDRPDRPTDIGRYIGEATLAFSPDGSQLAVGSFDGTISVFRIADDGSSLATVMSGHSAPIGVVTFLGNNAVVTGSDDGTARIWDVGSTATGKARSIVLTGHRGKVVSVVAAPDFRHVVTRGGGTVRVWRTTSHDAEPLVWPDATADPVTLVDPRAPSMPTCVDFAPDGSRVAVGSEDGSLKMWHADGRGEIRLLGRHEAEVTDVAFAPGGDVIASGSLDGTARLWSRQRDSAASKLAHDAAVHALAFSPEGETLATGCAQGKVRLWATEDGRKLPGLDRPEEGEITALAWSPDGHLLAIGSEAGIEVHRLREDARGGARIPRRVDLRSAEVASLAFHPDGTHLAVSSDRLRRGLTVWDLENPGEPVYEKPESSSAVAFSSDGRMLAAPSHDAADDPYYGAHLWRWQKPGAEPVPLDLHWGEVTDLAFDPLGSRLATVSRDGALRIWRIGYPDLLKFLATSTTACLTSDERSRYLLESPETASSTARECEESRQLRNE